jgi:FtsZ-binding cell division protein ZapB
MPKRPAAVLVIVLILAALFAASCASKSDLEAANNEVAFLKGDMEKLKAAMASQTQELKIAQGSIESLRQENRELRESMKASQEKPQNKSTGAKPKAKKRRR